MEISGEGIIDPIPIVSFLPNEYSFPGSIVQFLSLRLWNVYPLPSPEYFWPAAEAVCVIHAFVRSDLVDSRTSVSGVNGGFRISPQSNLGSFMAFSIDRTRTMSV